MFKVLQKGQLFHNMRRFGACKDFLVTHTFTLLYFEEPYVLRTSTRQRERTGAHGRGISEGGTQPGPGLPRPGEGGLPWGRGSMGH